MRACAVGEEADAAQQIAVRDARRRDDDLTGREILGREQAGVVLDAEPFQLVGLLDEMEEAGLVERRRDTEDRRRQIVVTTPAGRKLLIKARAVAKQLDDDFLASLTAEQRKQLQKMLLALAVEHVPNCQVTGLALVAE